MIKTEDQLQAAVIMWYRNKFPMLRGTLFHVPNGGARGGLQAKLLKATGVHPGVADLLLMLEGKTYCIELKKPSGGWQSPNQEVWEEVITGQGFEYVILNDLDEIKRYILGKILIVQKDEVLDTPNKQLDMFDNN